MIPYFLLAITLIGLFIDYRKTVVYVACLWPILNMFAGIGPIAYMKVFGIMALPFALFKKDFFRKSFPAYLPMLLYLAVIFAANSINEKHTPTMIGYLSTVILLPIIFWGCFKKQKDLSTFLKIWSIYFVVICVYGFFEAATGSNPFAKWMMTTEDSIFGGFRADSDEIRFGFRRIQSLMLFRDPCGSISAVTWGFLYYIRSYYPFLVRSKILNVLTKSLLYMLPFIVFLTGTRACIAMLCICFLGTIKKLRFKQIVMICIAFAVLFPFVSNYLNNILDAFTNTKAVDGSSLDMRQNQLYAVLMTLKQSPWVGNGFGAWEDYSLWSDELLGAESIWFQLLLKVGILGTIAYILIWFFIIRFIFKSELPYVFFIALSYLVGVTLSSLPGIDDMLIIIFISFAYRLKISFPNI